MDLKTKNHKISNHPATLKPGTTISECIRCGTCCEKGGPCFHIKDLAGSKHNQALRKSLEIICYDAEIRKLVVARGGLYPEMPVF